jgi:hypothetical protein
MKKRLIITFEEGQQFEFRNEIRTITKIDHANVYHQNQLGEKDYDTIPHFQFHIGAGRKVLLID